MTANGENGLRGGWLPETESLSSMVAGRDECAPPWPMFVWLAGGGATFKIVVVFGLRALIAPLHHRVVDEVQAYVDYARSNICAMNRGYGRV